MPNTTNNMYNPFNPTLPVINLPFAPALPPTIEPIEKTIVEPGSAGLPASWQEVRDWLAENMEEARTMSAEEISAEMSEQLGKKVDISTVNIELWDIGLRERDIPMRLNARTPEVTRNVQRARIQAWLIQNTEKASTATAGELSKEMSHLFGEKVYSHTVYYFRRRLGIAFVPPEQKGPGFEAWLRRQPENICDMTAQEAADQYFKETGIRLSCSLATKIKLHLGLSAPLGRPTSYPKNSYYTSRSSPQTTASNIASKAKESVASNIASKAKESVASNSALKRHTEMLQQIRQMFRIVARSEVDLRVKLGEPVEEDLAALAR